MAATLLLLALLLGPAAATVVVVVDGEGEQVVSTASSYNTDNWGELVLECRAEGEEVAYRWRFEGRELAGDEGGVAVDQGRLVFSAPLFGTFECLASGEGGVGYALVTLTEFVDQEVMVLEEGPEDTLVEEGGEVQAVCRARVIGEEVEGVEYRWTWNAEEVGEEWEVEELEGGSRVVGVGSGGVLGCLVTAQPGGERLYQEGRVAVASAPLPSITSRWEEPVMVLEGAALTLTCEVDGADAVLWRLPSGDEELGAVLEVEAVTGEEEGRYTCTASSPGGQVEEVAEVHVVRRTSILVEEAAMTITVGEALRLGCRFETDERWGARVETSWSKDGQALDYHQELLVIANVTVGDEGSYACVVTSPLDSATQDWQVEVVDPAFITDFLDYLLVLEGEAVELPCGATGIPEPSVAWSREGEEVVAEGGVVEWEAVAKEAAGGYTCTATNSAGTDSRTATLVVAAATSLEQPAEQALEKEAGQATTLGCQVSPPHLPG